MSTITCTSCEKDPGRGSTCQHCGARVYRYAIDEPGESTETGADFDDGYDLDGGFDLDLIVPSDDIDLGLIAPSEPIRRPTSATAPKPSQTSTSFGDLTKPNIPPQPKSTIEPRRRPAPLPRRRRSFRMYIFVAFIVIQILRRIIDSF